MNTLFHRGGVIASIILILLGLVSIGAGIVGHGEVATTLEREKITGSPDMTPEAVRAEVEEAGLEDVEGLPDCDVADEVVDTGAEAKCFAQYIRIHALEATGGRAYAEMGRFVTESGEETDDPAQAATDPDTGEPVANGARNIWVTATALSTALNTSYFAQQVARFSIAMGVALLLVGIGFLVLVRGMARSPGRET